MISCRTSGVLEVTSGTGSRFNATEQVERDVEEESSADTISASWMTFRLRSVRELDGFLWISVGEMPGLAVSVPRD